VAVPAAKAQIPSRVYQLLRSFDQSLLRKILSVDGNGGPLSGSALKVSAAVSIIFGETIML
jgi:hypothetical protein